MNAPARGSSSAETASMCARSGESPLRDGLRVIGRRPSTVRLNRNSAILEHIPDSTSRAVPSSIRVRRDGYRQAGEWQQAGGDQRDRAAQKVFARAGSRKPRSDQHQECSTTDNHGYRRLACRRPIKMSPLCPMIDLRSRRKDPPGRRVLDIIARPRRTAAGRCGSKAVYTRRASH